MEMQAVLPQRVQRPQPGNAGLGTVVQFRAVLNAQHHRLSAHPFNATIPMGGQYALPRDRFMGQQTVGRLGFRPAVAGHRNAGIRLRP
mgnify:CR=1 FL=1